MTVKDLKNKLNGYDDDLKIRIVRNKPTMYGDYFSKIKLTKKEAWYKEGFYILEIDDETEEDSYED